MNINFPSVDENFIRSSIETGYYSNATELVRDAVRRLRESYLGKQSRLQAALELGEADIRAGRTVPYTQELFNQMVQDGMRDAEAGIRPDPDVCP